MCYSMNQEIKYLWNVMDFCVITNSTGAGTFAITDTKPYVPGVTLSNQDNTKLLQQLKLGFKRTINWNKYQSKLPIERQNQYLIDLSFQGVNRLFVLSFKNNDDRKAHTGYFFPKVKIKDYNVMINGQNVFDYYHK